MSVSQLPLLSQSSVPPGHTTVVQTPELHCFPPEQTVAQFPQWLLSVFPFVSHPSDTKFELQSRNGAEHDWNTHDPDEQSVIALIYPHAVPHTPQFTRLFKGVSHPLDGLPSQFPKPPLHDES